MSVINDVAVEAFVADALTRIGPVDRLLDLGCGEQPYRRHYAQLARYTVAADYTVRSAISVRLSATALPFADNTFDIVLFSEVLEHIDDPFRAVMEIARVLKPDGQLLLTVPFNYLQHEIPHDYFRFTQFGLVSMLRQNGLFVQYLAQRGSLARSGHGA